MKIAVCMKQVPDSEARIAIDPSGAAIQTADLGMVINPYDEYAIEEALRIREAQGGEVIVVSVGPESAQAEIRKALAMGADKGVIVQEASYLGGDGLSIARILAETVRSLQPDLVLCGKLSIDVESDLVGIALAEYLGWPHVALATRIEWEGKEARVHREIEGGAEVVALSLPAVITAEKGLNEPRYASLKGIMAAKKKPIDIVQPQVAPEQRGPAAAKVSVVAMAPPPARTGGRKFTGEVEEVVPQVVELLRVEAKVL